VTDLSHVERGQLVHDNALYIGQHAFVRNLKEALSLLHSYTGDSLKFLTIVLDPMVVASEN
jgi:hypothetical protein